jgi:hypothetical protein
MGWLGALLALRLRQANLRFTWDDPDAPIRAWEASTGLVYPAGDPRSEHELALWGTWSRRKDLLAEAITSAAFVFSHKNPPHGGRYAMAPVWDGTARRAIASCYAVNVPAYVRSVRALIEPYRRPAEPGSITIRAHGFGPRCGNYVWGWSAPAWLTFPAPLDRPIALYGKPHRFMTIYAVPRGDHHVIGSSSIPQGQHPRADPQAVLRALQRWRTTLGILFPGVGIDSIGPPVEGWRPKPVALDNGHVHVEPDGRTLSLPPMYHSGVRWAPTVVDEALRMAGRL